MSGSSGIRWTQHDDGYRWIQHDERESVVMAATLVGDSPTRGVPRGWWNEPASSEPASPSSAIPSPHSVKQPCVPVLEMPATAAVPRPPPNLASAASPSKAQNGAKSVNRRHFQPAAGRLRALRAERDGTWLLPAKLAAFANNEYALGPAAADRPVTAFIDTAPRAPPLLSPRPPSPHATTAAGYQVERANISPLPQSPRTRQQEGYYMHASAKRPLLPLLALQPSTKLRHTIVDPPRTPRPLSAMVASSPRGMRRSRPNTANLPWSNTALAQLGLV